MAARSRPSVLSFYSGRSILVTGFTGFIGKVLVEKLLRSVPELRAIYVLIRPRKGASAKERLNRFFESDLFDLVRDSDILSKVIPIHGDILEPNLGILDDDSRFLMEKVSVVFHCAATVKFDEPLRQAMLMNVEGTRRLLAFCQRMKDFTAFVHVSTAYCECQHRYIVERVYPSAVHWRSLMKAIDWMDDAMLDRLTPFLIGSRPNTYTFTKALAESMITDPDEAHSGLPIIIVRPSIVTATFREPKPGWLDNYNGATGLIALGASGLVKTLYGRLHEVRADLVPVDFVVNTLIVAGWYRGTASLDCIPVVHCTSGRANPVTWGEIIDRMLEDFTQNMPLANIYRLPGGQTTAWRFEYKMRLLLNHLLPAYLLDLICALTGRPRKMVKSFDRIFKVLKALKYFYSQQWHFQSKGIENLNRALSADDRERFCIDARRIEWTRYLRIYNWGIRRYIFKEDESTLASAKRVHRRRKILANALEFTVALAMFAVLWRAASSANRMFRRRAFAR